MATTSIEWTEVTWNPTTGCDRVSPGCDHCYALTMAKRLKAMGSAKYQRDGDPRTSGPGFFIARVFAVMALAEQHTFQVLTKRHARMRSLLNDEDFRREVDFEAVALAEDDAHLYRRLERWPGDWWPLSNVWLGVSVEDQHWADIRIPALMSTPAAVRFLSCEPLLGPVDLEPFALPDWVIVGGESGPGARPVHPDWVRGRPDEVCLPDSSVIQLRPGFQEGRWFQRVGKTAAGRLLDGRTWDEFPEVPSA